MLKKLKEILEIGLANDLPGEEAHKLMMPIVRDDGLVKPNNYTNPVKSAVLVLFYKDEHGKIKFPLIQRPAYDGAHSAQVSLPGGKAEPFDANLKYTALREANEEIGIDPAQVDIVGTLSDIFIWVSNYIVTPVVGFINAEPQFQKDDIEVESIIETDLEDILNPVNRKEGTITVRGKYRIKTPYFDIDNRMVWGATAMMLSELSMVVQKANFVKKSMTE